MTPRARPAIKHNPEMVSKPWLCPHAEDHTPAPEGYIQWHAWAQDMRKTHRQRRCAGCGLFRVWEPKQAPAKGAAA